MTLKFRFPSNRLLNKNAYGAWYFYPDIFFHNFDEPHYIHQLSALSAANTRFLMVVDGHLKPAGWIRYYFEQFKGWLGFKNNCAVEKVQMAAKKLAYFGYLNGFNHSGVLNVISEWKEEYRPNEIYLQNCAKSRADDTSETLQEYLITFYCEHSTQLDAMHKLRQSIIFGQSYQSAQDCDLAVQLDIQNTSLIDNILPHLQHPSSLVDGSKCSKLYLDLKLYPIKQELEKRNDIEARTLNVFSSFDPVRLLEQAIQTLVLFPESKVEHVDMLIKLNLEIAKKFKKQDRRKSIKAYESALDLQNTYFSDSASYNEFASICFVGDDEFFDILHKSGLVYVKLWAQNLAGKGLKQYDASADNNLLLAYRISQLCLDSIQNDVLSLHIDGCLKYNQYTLAAKLVARLLEVDKEKALYYLGEYDMYFPALVESKPEIKKACAARNVLKGNKALSEHGLFHPSMEQAQHYFQKAAALDRNTAVEISPAYYFKEYVDTGKWKEAFYLVQDRVTKGLLIDMLPKASLDRLSQYYISQARTCYDRATVDLTPEDSCRRSIELVKQAIQVVNSDDNLMHLNSYKCRLAAMLTEGDEPARVDAALNILKEIERFPSIKQDSHLKGYKNLYIRILDKKISFLFQSCLSSSVIWNKPWVAEAKHKERCQHVLDDLLRCIDKQIILRDDEKQNYQQLAKLYFMKGDCIEYFKLQGDFMACFKKACELEKNQPFYFFRYSTALPSGSPGKEAANKTGKLLLLGTDLDQASYRQWYEERWQSHTVKFHRISMPEPLIQQSTASWLFGMR